MSEPAHTPGPWKVQEGYLTVYTTTCPETGTGFTNAIADVHREKTCAGSIVPEEEAIANARLIAAAPEMLAALIELRDAHWNRMPGRANELVESAVNKAKGAAASRCAIARGREILDGKTSRLFREPRRSTPQ